MDDVESPHSISGNIVPQTVASTVAIETEIPFKVVSCSEKSKEEEIGSHENIKCISKYRGNGSNLSDAAMRTG